MWNLEVKTLTDRVATASSSSLFEAAVLVVAGMVGLILFLSVTAMVLVYAERKVAARFQCRLGPMRVGWQGTLQTIADALKLLMKEDLTPTQADHFLHAVAPALSILGAALALIALPLSPVLAIADMNIGVLYISAVSGLGVLGILLGGWSSNNKWSLLGAMRAGAQIISYEITVTLALLVIVMLSGSMKLSSIILAQEKGWWIWRAPVVGVVTFLLYLVASIAELNRTPFDLAEGESELTAGFHTEYSGLRFAFFMLTEYLNLFVVAAVGATLFFGGWMPFHLGHWSAFNQVMDVIPPVLWFFGKACGLIFVIMWFRWTLPRMRVDQLMRLEWKILLPVGFGNLLVGAAMTLFGFYFFP